MIDNTFFDEMAKKISAMVPDSLKDIKKEMEQNCKIILHEAFNKMDLVTREEFDVQKKVLLKTRTKLEDLEKKITKLEAKQKIKKAKKDGKL